MLNNTKNNVFKVALLIVVIVSIAITAGLYTRTLNKKQTQPKDMGCTLEALMCPDGSSVGRVPPACEFAPCPTAAPQPTPILLETKGWKTYKLFDKVTIQYPAGVITKKEGDVYVFYKHGPSQTLGTEVFDGFILSIMSNKLGGKTLDEVVQEKEAQFQEIIEPPRAYTVAGEAGIRFRARGFGESTTIILPYGDTEYIEMSLLIEDPKNQGFKAIVDTMLSTLVLTHPLSNVKEYSCPDTEWVNCMPSPDGVSAMCSQDFLTWAETNCPNFKGAAY